MDMYSDKEYVTKNLKVSGIEKPVPTIIANHKKSNKVGYIFVGGLNATLSAVRLFKCDQFKNATIISFDARAQGDNKNKGTRNWKRYVQDVRYFINTITKKKEYSHIKQWNLLGESWGSSLCVLYMKLFGLKDSIINQVLIWNMPYSIVDISNKDRKEKNSDVRKTMLTFFFGIETQTKNKVNEILVDNPFVIRMFKMKNNALVNTTPTLAAWRSFKRGWKYFNKCKTDKIHYMQSSEDVLCNWKFMDKAMRKNKYITKIQGGTHILILDVKQRDTLLDWIVSYK